VNLPEQPPLIRSGNQPERSWWWRLESAGGDVVEVERGLADQRFPSQSDAESWVGEIWADLAEAGVEAVSLFDGERMVYGPMPLSAG